MPMLIINSILGPFFEVGLEVLISQDVVHLMHRNAQRASKNIEVPVLKRHLDAFGRFSTMRDLYLRASL